MNRKVIKQGNNAYTITLPIDWVRQNKIEGGDELNLTILNNDIAISTKDERIIDKKIEFKFSEKDLLEKQEFRYINRIYAALFKSGFDEIRFRTENIDIIEYITQRTNLFIGYEIVEEGSGLITIRSVVNPKKNEFESLLNRAFMIIKTISKSLIRKLKANDFNLNELLELEKTNNKVTDYLKRLLSKVNIKDSLNSRYYYAIISENEKLCDEYKYLIDYLLHRKSADEDIIQVLEAIDGTIDLLYKLTNSYDNGIVKQIAENRIKIINKIQGLKKTKDDNILFYLRKIIIHTYEICEPIIEMNLMQPSE